MVHESITVYWERYCNIIMFKHIHFFYYDKRHDIPTVILYNKNRIKLSFAYRKMLDYFFQ